MEQFGKVVDAILAAASKLGTQAERLWPDMVRTHYIQAWMALCVIVGMWFLCFVFLGIGLYASQKYARGPEDFWEGTAVFGFVCFAILTIVALTASSVALPRTIGSILYPEASYVRQLIGK